MERIAQAGNAGRPTARTLTATPAHLLVGAVLLVVGLGFAACGSEDAANVTGTPAQRFLSTSGHTVRLLLLADEDTSNGGMNFNGASAGAMTVTVPVGSHVEVTCDNDSTKYTNSCAVVAPSGTSPAFPGAETANPTTALRPARRATFSFTADRVGTYEIVSLTAGHRAAGQWDWFDVTRSGKPSIRGAQPPPPSG